MPRVGQLTAATLVTELPELGRIDGKTAVALAGLAPWPRDGGRQSGRRSIQSGRGKVQRVGIVNLHGFTHCAKPH